MVKTNNELFVKKHHAKKKYDILNEIEGKVQA